MSGTKIYQHPFKEGILSILENHFPSVITKRFVLVFEEQLYNKAEVKSIWGQSKTGVLTLEVYYKEKDETSEFICEIFSWESKKDAEIKLLQAIRDKLKAGVIGKDWVLQKKGGD